MYPDSKISNSAAEVRMAKRPPGSITTVTVEREPFSACRPLSLLLQPGAVRPRTATIRAPSSLAVGRRRIQTCATDFCPPPKEQAPIRSLQAFTRRRNLRDRVVRNQPSTQEIKLTVRMREMSRPHRTQGLVGHTVRLVRERHGARTLSISAAPLVRRSMQRQPGARTGNPGRTASRARPKPVFERHAAKSCS